MPQNLGPEIALILVLGVCLIAIGGLAYFMEDHTSGYLLAGMGLLTLYIA